MKTKNIAKIGLTGLLFAVGVSLFNGCDKYDRGNTLRNFKAAGEYKSCLDKRMLKITKLNAKLNFDSWMIQDPTDSTKSIPFDTYLDRISNKRDRAIEKAFLYKTADSLDAQLKR